MQGPFSQGAADVSWCWGSNAVRLSVLSVFFLENSTEEISAEE